MACGSTPRSSRRCRTSRSARARSSATRCPRTWSARWPSCAGRARRSSPARRWSSTEASTSIEALTHRAPRRRRAHRPQPRRARARRRPRAGLGAGRRRAGRRAALVQGRARRQHRVAHALRPGRLRAGRRGLSTHASGAGHPLPALRRHHDRLAGRRAHAGPGRGVVRARPRPGAGHDGARRALGLRPRHAPPRGVGRPAHDQVRRSRRRRQAQDSARHDLPRAAGAPLTRSGGQVLVDQLVLHGAGLAFGVPGESYLAVLDALHDAPLRLIAPRHEGGAANMAEAYGKLTGRPGICMVTRGPGATHASNGVHTAFQDSTPMLLLIGQVARDTVGREGFQELDYRAMYGPIAKWATQVDDAARLPEIMARAFAAATSGRPGPVVIALPEDMLTDRVDVPDGRRAQVPAASPGEPELARLGELLAGAERPLIVVGEGGWTAQAAADVAAFAEGQRVPLGAAGVCQDYVDNTSPAYAGHAGLAMDPALATRIREADLLIAVGGRLGEITSAGYTLVRPGVPAQRLVHVHPDPDELGAVYRPELGIVSGLARFAAAARALAPAGGGRRAGLLEAAHAEYLANLREARRLPGPVQLTEVMAALRERLGPDAILTNGAGNFAVWAHRYYEFRRYPAQLAPRSGSMGYGVPAAVAAKAVHPDRAVVCVAGDGDFLMTGQELATAVQEDLAILVLVVNNGMYGTIRMHQERRYPGRVGGTAPRHPDFLALARAYGAHGALFERTQEIGDALDEALACGRPAVIELRGDPQAITPRETIYEIREAAR